MVAVVAMPAGLLLPVIDPSFLSGDPALRTVDVVAAWLWFALPIGLLSSMSVGSLFAVLRPAVVWNLLRVLPRRCCSTSRRAPAYSA